MKTTFKKIRGVIVVALVLILVTVGAVGSTMTNVMAIPTEDEEDSSVDETGKVDVWKAKQFLKMFARCARATRAQTGDDLWDVMKTVNAIGNEGVWKEYDDIPKSMRTSGDYDFRPHVDAIAGRGKSATCYSTFDGSSGLIATTINALNKIRNKSEVKITVNGRETLVPTTSWDSWGNESLNEGLFRRAAFLCTAGFRAYTQQGTPNKSVNDAANKNWTCEEQMVYPVTGSYSGVTKKDQLGLQQRGGTKDGDVSSIINDLWGIFRTDSFRGDKKDLVEYYYHTYLEGLENGCSTYKNISTERPNTSYTIIEVPRIDPSGKRISTEYVTMDSSDIENFHSETVAYTLDEGAAGGRLKVPCNSTKTKDDMTLLTKEYFKNMLVEQNVAAKCLDRYQSNVDTYSQNWKQSKSDAIVQIKGTVTAVFDFSNRDTQIAYNMYYSQSIQSGVSSALARYEANKAYVEKYKQEINYDEVAKTASAAIDMTAQSSYSGAPGACYGSAKTTLEKITCNIKLLNGSDANLIDKTDKGNYQAIQDAIAIIMPVYRTEIAVQAVNSIESAYDTVSNNINTLKKSDEVKSTFYNLKFIESISESVDTITIVSAREQPLRYFDEGPIKYNGTEYSCRQQEYLSNKLTSPESNYNSAVRAAVSLVGLTFSPITTEPKEDPTDDNLKGVVENNVEIYNGTDASKTCESNALMGWIICKVTYVAREGAEWLYESVVEQSLQMDSSDLAANGEGAHQAWGYFVGFANILLVILFLFVIFSQLTGYGIDNYGIKRILPKLIVVAVLINLSFIICQLAVDVSNVLGHGLESMLDGIKVDKATFAAGESEILNKIIGWLLGGIGLGAAAGGAYLLVKEGKSFITGLLVPALLALLIALIAVLFFFIILGIRRAGILALVVISPMAIVCYALPNTKKFYDKWFNGLKSLLMVYPVCGLMLGMSRFVARLISSGSDDFISNLVAMAVLVYPFFVIPTLVSKAISTVTSLGDKVAQLGRGLRKKTDSGIKNTAAYQDAQKRREAATNDRRQRAFRNFQDGTSMTGRLFGGKRRDYIKKQRALDVKIAAAQQRQLDKKATDDERRAAAQEEANARAEKAANTKAWLRRGGEAIENEYAKIISEDAKDKARVDYDRESTPQVMKDKDGNVITDRQGNPIYMTTADAIANTARIQAVNTTLSQLARADQPPREINVSIATSRAMSAHQSEEYKAFSEQFSALDKPGLQNALHTALDKFARGEGDSNEVQAAVDLMQKAGNIQETLEEFDSISGEAWEGIKRDPMAMSTIRNSMSRSNNILMKGYSDYLADAKENENNNPVSFNQWLNGGADQAATDAAIQQAGINAGNKAAEKLVQEPGESDVEFEARKAMARSEAAAKAEKKTRELSSLEAYKDANYGDTGAMLVNADKDTLKFINEKFAAGELGNAINREDLGRASVSKSGEELNVVNKVVKNSVDNATDQPGVTIKRQVDASGTVTGYVKLTTVTNPDGSQRVDITTSDQASYIEAYKKSVADFKFTNENFGKLDMSTWFAMTGNGDPDLEQAFREQYAKQIEAIKKDKRIWHKIPPELQAKLLGPGVPNPDDDGGDAGDDDPLPPDPDQPDPDDGGGNNGGRRRYSRMSDDMYEYISGADVAGEPLAGTPLPPQPDQPDPDQPTNQPPNPDDGADSYWE